MDMECQEFYEDGFGKFPCVGGRGRSKYPRKRNSLFVMIVILKCAR
jgi:hypothetical protein